MILLHRTDLRGWAQNYNKCTEPILKTNVHIISYSRTVQFPYTMLFISCSSPVGSYSGQHLTWLALRSLVQSLHSIIVLFSKRFHGFAGKLISPFCGYINLVLLLNFSFLNPHISYNFFPVTSSFWTLCSTLGPRHTPETLLVLQLVVEVGSNL